MTNVIRLIPATPGQRAAEKLAPAAVVKFPARGIGKRILDPEAAADMLEKILRLSHPTPAERKAAHKHAEGRWWGWIARQRYDLRQRGLSEDAIKAALVEHTAQVRAILRERKELRAKLAELGIGQQ